MEDPIIKCEQSSDPRETMESVSEDNPAALSLPANDSLTTIPLPSGDPGVGNNQLITGFTAESRLRKAQARAAYAREQVERLRQLQTTTKETLDEAERSLRDIRKEIAGLQESDRQKKLLVAECKKEIDDRAKLI